MAEDDAIFKSINSNLAPTHGIPVRDIQKELWTDASICGIGALLLQRYIVKKEGRREEEVVNCLGYACRGLGKTESSFAIAILEMSALVYGLKCFKIFLYFTTFIVYLDSFTCQ